MNKWIGRNVIDKVTGFAGRATGYVEYITGCNQVLVTPRVTEPSKWPEGMWIDDTRLDYVDDSHLDIPEAAAAGARGPDKAPPVR